MRYRFLGLALAVLTTGCLVDVDVQQTRNPEAAFNAARKEASEVQGVPGRATDIQVVVYDPKDEQLVRVSVPFWLARKVSQNDSDEDNDFIPASARKHVRFSDLEKAGKGTVVEVEEDNGEHVLVWLR